MASGFRLAALVGVVPQGFPLSCEVPGSGAREALGAYGRVCSTMLTFRAGLFLMPRHRLCHRIHLEPVVLDLADLVPLEPGGVQDGFLEHRLPGAVGHHVEPEAVGPVLGNPVLVGAEEDRSRLRGQPLDLDELQVPGLSGPGWSHRTPGSSPKRPPPAGPGPLVLHDHPHGGQLGLRAGLQVPDLWVVPVGVGEDQHGGHPLHPLEGQGLLLFQFPPPPFPPVQGLRVPVLGLGQPSFRPLDLFFDVFQPSQPPGPSAGGPR